METCEMTRPCGYKAVGKCITCRRLGCDKHLPDSSNKLRVGVSQEAEGDTAHLASLDGRLLWDNASLHTPTDTAYRRPEVAREARALWDTWWREHGGPSVCTDCLFNTPAFDELNLQLWQLDKLPRNN